MNNEMEKDILKVLVTEEELKTRVAERSWAMPCTRSMRAAVPCSWGF